MTKNPFEGIHLIDLARAGVGTFIVKFLAQHGTTTVRVESGRFSDPVRSSLPFAPTFEKGEKPGLERSFLFSHGHPFPEYGMMLDFSKPKAIEVFKRLVSWADVLVENFAPGQMKKFGIDYEHLKKIKPDLIMLSSSGYGQTGPMSGLGAFGQQLSAIAGMDELAAWPDRSGVPLGTYYTDVLAPMYGVSAIVAALDYRRRTGKGQYIDHCQAESGMAYLAPLFLEYSANKRLLKRTGNQLDYAAPHGVYQCKGDDRWVAIAVFTDEEWESFCYAIGDPAWTKDPKFSSLGNRVKNADELDKLVNEWTLNFSAPQVMERLQAAGVAAGQVSDGKDLSEDPQLNAREFYREMDHPYIGKHRHYHPPAYKLSEAEPVMGTPVLLGEHTEYVATQILGMSDEEFVQLMVEGVFE